MVGQIYRWSGAAFLFGLVFITVPALLTQQDVIATGSVEGNFTVGLVELVALVIPALAIFTQATLQYSYQREERSGKSGGLGPFGPEELRGGLLLAAGLSTLCLLMGLTSLLAALQLPPTTIPGVGLILVGIAFIPAIVVCVGVLALREKTY